MRTERLNAFSDGVFAILITIMVLDLRAPEGTDLAALRPVVPAFATYVLSFVFLGIYWNNHHHLFQLVTRTNGRIGWANLHLLFWLSLIPAATGWMGQHRFATAPTAVYGGVLLAASGAYGILQAMIISDQGSGSPVAAAVGRDGKGKASPLLYAAGVGATLADRWAGVGVYVLVAVMWLVPDRRVEALIRSRPSAGEPVTKSAPGGSASPRTADSTWPDQEQ